MAGRLLPPLPTERQLQAQVVEYAQRTGWTVWQLYLGSRRGGQAWMTQGMPDLYLFRPGVTLWIELKRGTQGRISPIQHARHGELRLCGIPCHVARSFDEARAVLDAARLSRTDRETS